MPHPSDNLRSIHNFNELVQYLEDKLDWPLQGYEYDDITYEYDPEELGLKDDDAAKVKNIRQLRPLQTNQPWGIFFVEFEKKKLPVVVLRRILSHLVVKKRASANRANEAAWHSEDLLFVTAFGEDDTIQREIAFAHFHQSPGDLPTLRVLGWDGGDTPLKLSYVDKVLQERLHWPEDPSDHKAWREQWQAPFKHRIGHVIRTADSLAEAMAALARGINDKAKRMLAAESDSGPLKKLHKAFQAALIHDLTEESFADTYAQTITYGLLTAAISRTEGSEGRHGTFIIAENVTDMVPITNPFLKEMLQTFLKVGGRKGGIDFDELGIQDVVDLLRGDETDLPAILRDFGNKTQGEDPVIHFYEHFLAAYNKKLKVQRGVFYTPKPVVSYIVRSVHELLQTEFGLEDGLASTVTWGEMTKKFPELKIPAGVSPDSPFVMVLDPATGTATFLVEVIDVIHKTMLAKWQRQGKGEQEIGKLWNEYIPKHLLPRIYGYELMMAPYAIAHMKIGLKLFETGYQFMSSERVRVYLTNALEPASDDQQKLVGIVPALAHEADAVNAVKRNVRFTVVVGNPPYSISSSNNSEWIQKLTFSYKVGLGETNINSLSDDYIKFWRFTENLLGQVSIGVVGMITNNSFLDGITHRQMRASLLQSYFKLFFIDLHGSTKIAEKIPFGLVDENVFDIQQGVGISVLVSKHFIRPGKALHYDCFGSRADKYKLLSNASLSTITWDSLEVRPPNYFFKPKDLTYEDEYKQGWSVSKIFKTFSTGIKFRKDNLLVKNHYCSNDVEQMLTDIHKLPPPELFQKYDFNETDDWLLSEKRKFFNPKNTNDISKVAYRPFDFRYTYYPLKDIKNIIVRGDSRAALMKHLILGCNISLITTRLNRQVSTGYFLVTRDISDLHILDNARDSVQVFPLYLKDETLGLKLLDSSSSNITRDFYNALITKIDKNLASRDLFSPENIFNYTYALFHSPTYRIRYSEFLKIDFPRIPITSNLGLFRSLAELGGELVALHLLESSAVNNFITTFSGKGDNSVPKKPTWKDNAVWINTTQRFEGVPEKVWNFHIGGYQVCEKWLKDRKGRTLSDDDIAHYQRIVVALSETIRIMAEIDDVIDEHGGWPIK